MDLVVEGFAEERSTCRDTRLVGENLNHLVQPVLKIPNMKMKLKRKEVEGRGRKRKVKGR